MVPAIASTLVESQLRSISSSADDFSRRLRQPTPESRKYFRASWAYNGLVHCPNFSAPIEMMSDRSDV
jgi:hypothetical protein